MSGPRWRRTPFDLLAMAARATASIWPAPGTVRSIMYFGIWLSSFTRGAVVAPGGNLRTPGPANMRHSPPRTAFLLPGDLVEPLAQQPPEILVRGEGRTVGVGPSQDVVRSRARL